MATSSIKRNFVIEGQDAVDFTKSRVTQVALFFVEMKNLSKFIVYNNS